MKPITWSHEDNEYRTSLLDFNAIITKLPQSQTFAVRIEDNRGNVLDKHALTFDDFADAESWALFMIVELEQSGDRQVAQKRMLQSIDYSRSFLPSTIHLAHLQRLDFIREWIVTGRDQENELVNVSVAQPSMYPLDWSDSDTSVYLADTPHGQAIIREERAKKLFAYGTTSKYKVRIRHSTGAIYESLQTFIDFADAETWVQEALTKLNDPRIAEYYLDNLHFTLEICKHALPPESDPLHSERLDHLIRRFDEVLP